MKIVYKKTSSSQSNCSTTEFSLDRLLLITHQLSHHFSYAGFKKKVAPITKKE